MGLHPAERVRVYRGKGYWTDGMIDALLRERVRQFGDITAITDPLNRETLLDGPFRTLTWPELDEQVSRLAQALLAQTEGIWSLLKRSMVNFAAADLDGLVRIVKRKLKKIQYRPHLIDGCLTGTGLIIEPW